METIDNLSIGGGGEGVKIMQLGGIGGF